MRDMAAPKSETDDRERTSDGSRHGLLSGRTSVDRQASPSLSFAAQQVTQPPNGGRSLVPVGPGRASPVYAPLRESGERVSEFPLQLTKIQRPALRSETLQRDRLLDWLSAQSESRVILVTAEAGYGKTTLLADFSRRTRRRVLWYRIDTNDRSWVNLIRYLVATGREVDPQFGSNTQSLLDRMGSPDPPARDEVVKALIADFGPLGSSGGTILILDDYHLVDDVAEIRQVLNEFVAQAPDRLTIVLAGRRSPSLALARLRSTGAVVELRTADLRFDIDESERLFRDIYHRDLDQDLLADLAGRVDGWAACLQLVQAALRDRTPVEIREFIEGLSGASGDLYDYLAEEVVGDLLPATQTFLMRIALLQSVHPGLAAVVGEVDTIEASRMIAEADDLSLLGRRSDIRSGGRRYHPLVQEFLEARLRREVGDEEIVRLHRLIARHAMASDWRLAAYHLAAAGDIDELHRLVEASVPSIMAGGDFAIAETFIDRLPDGRTSPVFNIVLSRMELHRDRPEDAVRLAESAVASQRANGPGPILDQALVNLASVYHHVGRFGQARHAGLEVCERNQSGELAAIARAMVLLIDGSIDGALDVTLDHLLAMAEVHRTSGDHYLGITQLNVAEVQRAIGNADGTLEAAEIAIAALSASSASHEIGAARLNRSWALSYFNRMEEAQKEIDVALGSRFERIRDELRYEALSILFDFGDQDQAKRILTTVGPLVWLAKGIQDQHPVAMAQLDITEGAFDSARLKLESIDVNEAHREPCFKARVMFLKALSAALAGHDDARLLSEIAHGQAVRQGSMRWSTQAEILRAAIAGGAAVESVFRRRGADASAWISVMAELFLSDLIDDSPHIQTLVEAEAKARPGRWLPGLRRSLVKGNQVTRRKAAGLLDLIGEMDDVASLRAFAKQSRGSVGSATIGRGLARRVAPPVLIADLGRVGVQIGPRVVHGDAVRRKVLALLCFLVTRPSMEAARDQVVDALWPDQDPAAASNSLNQTVYFLRRIFEPNYLEDQSPGYVRHETDLIWLDPELVRAQSADCKVAMEQARRSSTWTAVDLVSQSYAGRFALDFEYEEWSVTYRDNLHASYLEVIQAAVDDAFGAARFDRAIQLCRRALDVDPNCEPIERQLLRIYKATGAHAAAEEQYRHYASAIEEDLGVSAPPLNEL